MSHGPNSMVGAHIVIELKPRNYAPEDLGLEILAFAHSPTIDSTALRTEDVTIPSKETTVANKEDPAA